MGGGGSARGGGPEGEAAACRAAGAPSRCTVRVSMPSLGRARQISCPKCLQLGRDTQSAGSAGTAGTRPRLGDTSEASKCVCNDPWQAVFCKQVDILKTHHRARVHTHSACCVQHTGTGSPPCVMFRTWCLHVLAEWCRQGQWWAKMDAASAYTSGHPRELQLPLPPSRNKNTVCAFQT